MTDPAVTYRFVDTYDGRELKTGKCIRRSGQSKAAEDKASPDLNDTPSLCGRVLEGQRLTRADGPVPGEKYDPEMLTTVKGPFPRWCRDCLRIWRYETGQDAANDNAADLKLKALDDMREDLRRCRRDHDRYEARVVEQDARLIAIGYISSGEWCKAQSWVNDHCAKLAGKK